MVQPARVEMAVTGLREEALEARAAWAFKGLQVGIQAEEEAEALLGVAGDTLVS